MEPDLKPSQNTGGLPSDPSAASSKTSDEGHSMSIAAIDPGSPGADNASVDLPLASASQSSTGGPQIADDSDLIEKEWVDKVKEIVNRTIHDPYAQNEQLNQLKVDYLAKRYGKVIESGQNG